MTIRSAIDKNSINLYDVSSISIMGDATYGINHVLTIAVKSTDGCLYAIHLHNPIKSIKIKKGLGA